MPTSRQERAAKALLENDGKSVSAAMRKAGYSDASASNPHRLTRTKTWQELMDKYLPDEKLAKTHEKLLGAKFLDHMVFPTEMTKEAITTLIKSVGGTPKKFQWGQSGTHVWFWADNTKAQHDATQMAYKLKGYLKDVAEVGVRQLGDVLDDLEDDTGAQAREALDTPANE